MVYKISFLKNVHAKIVFSKYDFFEIITEKSCLERMIFLKNKIKLKCEKRERVRRK